MPAEIRSFLPTREKLARDLPCVTGTPNHRSIRCQRLLVPLCQRRQPPEAGAVGQRLQRATGQPPSFDRERGWRLSLPCRLPAQKGHVTPPFMCGLRRQHQPCGLKAPSALADQTRNEVTVFTPPDLSEIQPPLTRPRRCWRPIPSGRRVANSPEARQASSAAKVG